MWFLLIVGDVSLHELEPQFCVVTAYLRGSDLDLSLKVALAYY